MPDVERGSSDREKPTESTEAPLVDVLGRLQKVVGPEAVPLPEEMSQEELIRLQEENIRDHRVETFNELFRHNELQYRTAALQREARFKSDEKPSTESVAELVAANQAATYHEYFLRVMNHVTGVMRRYTILRASIRDVPQSLKQDEAKADLYLRALEEAVAERVAFSNVLLIDAQFAEHKGDTKKLLEIRERALAQLTAPSQEALRGDTDAKWHRGNQLNQKLIDILSGNHGIQGLEQGFLPQRLYTDLLKHRYKQLLDRQKEISVDPDLSRAQSRMRLLEQKHELAKQGKGEFTKADEAEYATLQRQVRDRNAEMDRLGEERRGSLRELLSLSQELGGYQLDQAELSTIQNQFGESVDLTNAEPPRPDTTPSFVRKAIDEQMEIRSNHHMDRMLGMMGTLEEEVLETGVAERVEDVWNKKGREMVRRVAHKIASVVTIPVPEMAGMKGAARDALTEPLDEALGWPPGKDTWKELTHEEKEHVIKKHQSVLDAIEKFDRAKMQRLRETIIATKDMPDASDYVGQEVKEPLPSVRVTPENREQLIKEHGGATVYFLLFHQMEQDWGSADPPQGFLGEFSHLLTAIDENVQGHIDVGKALHEIGNVYEGMMRKLLLAALLLLGVGILTGAVGARVLRKVAGHTLRAGGRMVKGSIDMVRGLRQSRTAEYMTRMRYLQREQQLARMLENTRLGRWFARMPALRNMRFARAGGATVRMVGWAAVPAVAAYEMYLNEERVQGTDNEELKAEYRKIHGTIALESAGVGATLFLPSLGPAIVLAIPVIWAGSYNRDRSEIAAWWKRESEDWMRERDSAGLRQALAEINEETAVEAGGGGTLKPRIYFPSAKDQEDAVEQMHRSNKETRRRVYEAYFRQNLLVPDGTSKEDISRIIREKVDGYMGILTHRGFNDVPNMNLRLADAYAELVERRRMLERAGEPPMLSYEDEKGERHFLDLTRLTPATQQNRQDVLGIVAEYVNHIRPMEDIYLLYTIGQTAKERKGAAQTRALEQAQERARTHLFSRLMHHLHDAEYYIRTKDWPGLELTGGETTSQNIIRSYIAEQLRPKVQSLIDDLLGGQCTPEKYTARLREIENILVELRDIPDTEQYLEKAKKGVPDLEKAQVPATQPIYALFLPAEKK